MTEPNDSRISMSNGTSAGEGAAVPMRDAIADSPVKCALNLKEVRSVTGKLARVAHLLIEY